MLLNKLYPFVRKMGVRYLLFRSFHELMRRVGLMQYLYPVQIGERKYVSLERWKEDAVPFFWVGPQKIEFSESQRATLKEGARRILSGKIQFFTGKWINLGNEYDWVTNPENGFRFDATKHWTRVDDFRTEQGDIKFVWEKSRFLYFYTIIRSDLANNSDSSAFIWDEIVSWISHNPCNCGPNYKCSQEISIRVLNWIFALYWYKNSGSLSGLVFSAMVNAIHVQVQHVERNILFSRIAVRNNHAITEALCLFTVGLLFPWFPESRKWAKKGKKYLEEEGCFQIYDDGAYIQHSFNYQRVVIQLYTWALALAKLHKIEFCDQLIVRLKQCNEFLQTFVDPENGMVPNWGANDSALFFPLNSADARDYRPQINALAMLLNEPVPYGKEHIHLEDCSWFSGGGGSGVDATDGARNVYHKIGYPTGGYYSIRTAGAATFIRCARHVHRPFHADNLHVDIWWDHENIMRDAGTYKYNTERRFLQFFSGTSGHNSVTIDRFDQMDKWKRFIWYNWSQAIDAVIEEQENFILFEGTIAAFQRLGIGITHRRIVKVHRTMPLWVINDIINFSRGHVYRQHWNVVDRFSERGFSIASRSAGSILPIEEKAVWFSDRYGEVQDAYQLVFSSTEPEFTTCIYHESCKHAIDGIMQ